MTAVKCQPPIPPIQGSSGARATAPAGQERLCSRGLMPLEKSAGIGALFVAAPKLGDFLLQEVSNASPLWRLACWPGHSSSTTPSELDEARARPEVECQTLPADRMKCQPLLPSLLGVLGQTPPDERKRKVLWRQVGERGESLPPVCPLRHPPQLAF